MQATAESAQAVDIAEFVVYFQQLRKGRGCASHAGGHWFESSRAHHFRQSPPDLLPFEPRSDESAPIAEQQPTAQTLTNSLISCWQDRALPRRLTGLATVTATVLLHLSNRKILVTRCFSGPVHNAARRTGFLMSGFRMKDDAEPARHRFRHSICHWRWGPPNSMPLSRAHRCRFSSTFGLLGAAPAEWLPRRSKR